MSRLILITVALLLLTGCLRPQSKAPPAAAPAPPAKPKIAYNQDHDAQIKEVLALAKKDQWEEARIKTTELVKEDPKNMMLLRLQTWVDQQGQKRREQSLEDQIRKIDAKNSVFNPTDRRAHV